MSILIEAKRIEARYALLESLDNSNRKSYVQWETVGTYLREAALSPQQIQGLFGEIEKATHLRAAQVMRDLGWSAAS